MSNQNTGIIALINCDEQTFKVISTCDFQTAQLMQFKSGLELSLLFERDKLNIIAIISCGEVISPVGIYLLETLQRNNFPNIPYFLIVNKINDNLSTMCMKAGVADVFSLPVNKLRLETRINFLVKSWGEMSMGVTPHNEKSYSIPLAKRIFDIVFSGLAIIMLLPVLLLIILIMKIESKGPVFYYSFRVGTGYRIFKFFKLRSMYVNADKRLKDLKHLNQYAGKDSETTALQDANVLCDKCLMNSTPCQQVLYADGNSWCEKNFINARRALSGSAFFKLKNDPRVTRVGKFLRNTSMDELPQLWNVFIGDMSIVGNRPLPLYEAEKLTTDKYALRFRAPAGITGLWQVEKRGKSEMSEEERLMLDNIYAEKHSFASDIVLILKTIPALFQKESV
jgi:lipopolysaccharide/colanic/teichoic acid biosynthesis glycosyltransferase